MAVEFSNGSFHYYLCYFSSAQLRQDTSKDIAVVAHVLFLLWFLPRIMVNLVNKMPR